MWFWSFSQFSRLFMSNFLRPNGLQHARLPCPSLTPGACLNSCPLSQWCHPTISFSVVPSLAAFILCQHQDLFQWVSSLHQVAIVLGLQHQSFQWISSVKFNHSVMSDSVTPWPESRQASLSITNSWSLLTHVHWVSHGILMNIQDQFPLGLICLISFQSKGLSIVFSYATVQKHQFFGTQLSLWSNSHIHTWPTRKTTALTRWTFVGKVSSLLFDAV